MDYGIFNIIAPRSVNFITRIMFQYIVINKNRIYGIFYMPAVTEKGKLVNGHFWLSPRASSIF